jgi:hemolysin III
MSAYLATRSDYNRAEILSDAAVQVAGLLAALVAVPVLVRLSTVWRTDPYGTLSTLIYGATLIAMLLCSTLYHIAPNGKTKCLLGRLDRSAIYFTIAGTYTPFLLLSGGRSVPLLTGLWGTALAGAILRLREPDRYKWIAFGLYLAMGWAGMLAGGTIFAELSPPVMALILTGGILYTVGTIFFLIEVLPFHNTIWHVFVLIASATFYAAVTLHLADMSAPLSIVVP